MEENHVDIIPIITDNSCEFCDAYYQLDEDYKSKIMQFMIHCKVMQDMRRNNKKFED